MPKKQRLLHLSVKSQLLDGLRRRHFKPGVKLPSQYALANTLQVSQGTVAKAIRELRDEGVLESKPRSGVYFKKAEDCTKSGTILYLSNSPYGDSPSAYDYIQAGINRSFINRPFDITYKSAFESVAEAYHGFKEGTTFRDYVPVSSLRGQNIRALITMNVMDLEYLCDLKNLSCPIVVIDRDAMDIGLDCIVLDNTSTSFQMTQRFIQQGHRHIGFLGKILPSTKDNQRGYDPATGQRLQGFAMAHQLNALPIHEKSTYHAPGPRENFSIGENASALLKQFPQCSAIVSEYEDLGLIQSTLAEFGRRDIPIATWNWGPNDHSITRRKGDQLSFYSLDNIIHSAANIVTKKIESMHTGVIRHIISGTIYYD